MIPTTMYNVNVLLQNALFIRNDLIKHVILYKNKQRRKFDMKT